jgi:putative ABC transport system permease protein
MMRTGLQALLSHWWRHPFQLATLILGLALATALWSGVQAINAEARASYDAAAATLGETRYTQLLPAAGETVDEAVFARLRQAGWLVSPVVEGRIEAGGRAVRLVGIDALSAPPDVAPGAAGGPGGEEGGGAALLQFITPPGQLVVNPATAPALRDAVAAELVLSDDIPPGTALGDVGIVQTLLGAERRLSRFILLPDQPRARPPLAEIAPELTVSPARDRQRRGAADRQLSPEPDGLWPAVLRCRAFHRAWRHRAGLRAAAPGVPHPARARPAACNG